ncbi:hypothetical protein V495_03027 [Pseudogymnoascus sp. VKM F-4514 (FW-929)]|nr:hypothetical protein V495_03027 [Pseudogymnoascus sp. VKM F-4514 (FW-929)]
MGKTEDAKALANEAPSSHIDTHGLIVSTMNDIPGYRVTNVHGTVYGLTVQSRNWGADIGAILRSIVGGEIKLFTNLMYRTRNTAQERLVGEAMGRGANAVIALRFDAAELCGFAQVCAYGTAVTVEKSKRVPNTFPRGEELRFDAAELCGFAQVCAYGTAVTVEKI